jgi:hypothetical protein
VFHTQDGVFFKRNDNGSVTVLSSSVHRCKICGALWRRWANDGSWSLYDANQKCGKCCDNEHMGRQIEEIVPPTGFTFDASTWQSIVASMSTYREANYSFYLAGVLHNGQLKTCKHILGEKFAGAGGPCGLFFDMHYMLDTDHAFKS